MPKPKPAVTKRKIKDTKLALPPPVKPPDLPPVKPPDLPQVQNPGMKGGDKKLQEISPVQLKEPKPLREPADNPASLLTPTDIRRTREKLLEQQEGLDPVLKRKIKPEEGVLDHDHRSQHCRAVLHRQTNAFEGLVFNAYRRCLEWLDRTVDPKSHQPHEPLALPAVLRNLADYLEGDYSKNPYHPGWLKRVQTDFRGLPADKQRVVLARVGAEVQKDNAEGRLEAFKAVLLTKKYGYPKIEYFISQARELT